MQEFIDYIKTDTVFLQYEVKNRHELFQKVSQQLSKSEYILPGFLKFIEEREDNYPTGLKLSNSTVAIPHGDTKYINKSFIAIITLKKAIKMYQMDAPEKSILVKTFFVLGLKDGNSHLKLLKNIIKIIQTPGFLDELQKTKNIIDIKNLFAKNNFD